MIRTYKKAQELKLVKFSNAAPTLSYYVPFLVRHVEGDIPPGIGDLVAFTYSVPRAAFEMDSDDTF